MMKTNMTAFLAGITVASSAGYFKLHKDVRLTGDLLTSSLKQWSEEVTNTTRELDNKVDYLENELRRVRNLSSGTIKADEQLSSKQPSEKKDS
eukprot:jgi/Galph1/5016/GphlegSOOS_G3664.1